MKTAIVKWFNAVKGYGFLVDNENGKEVFFHHSVIEMEGYRALNEEEAVQFECQQTPKGLQATMVRRISSDDPAAS